MSLQFSSQLVYALLCVPIGPTRFLKLALKLIRIELGIACWFSKLLGWSVRDPRKLQRLR